jgi:hypothetical protein
VTQSGELGDHCRSHLIRIENRNPMKPLAKPAASHAGTNGDERSHCAASPAIRWA